MEPEKYAIVAPYLSLIFLYLGILMYGQRRQWKAVLIQRVLRILVVIGALGVVYSFYMLIRTGNVTYAHVSFAWLLLEFGSIQISQWLKEGALNH